MAYLFGNWRPWVRVPPLRPKDKDFPYGSPSFFAPSRCTDLDTVALATWVRIPSEAVGSSLTKGER